MSQSFVVVVEGLKNLGEVGYIRRDITLAKVQALNKTAERGRTQAARMIREQINLPASYLNPSSRRLYVSRQATRAKPEAVITARGRATSLARFATSGEVNKAGVRVEVAPGKARYMRRAFLIRLPAGRAPIETKSNLGLAIRLRKGETLKNKRDVVKMEKGLYLLYGPSVDQVFLDRAGAGVAKDLEPELLDQLEAEFIRLVDL